MSPSKPTIIVLHGSWHSPPHYERLTSLLTEAQYPPICPTQPTFDAKPPTKTLYDDADFVRSMLTELVEQEQKEVILVLHSYGGVLGTQAVTEDFSRSAREKKGLKGGVIHLLFMTGFVLHNGECLASPLGGSLPPFIPVEEDGSCNMLEPARRLYNDLPTAEQEHWVSLLRPHPEIASLTPLTNVGYKYVPSTYLFCENDQALPLEVQKSMVASVEGEVFGGKMGEVSCGAGHSPFLSMPEKVVEVIDGLW
ncbi:alpha/beta-hydrolase [Mollisia scopiformis]|uniref:Alpha/beta-hydrolase n=1 Tax=Mollisia scopiformis TaxID=149040 RepID=A0A132B8W7_MOLSC|nr:alpha/beta-hydrolase [Mollisia scopiformis]KUJ08693.1 alpha/beta-hydrolase [Mollisia scopiformis]